jgi:hypothetical protein
LESSLKVSVDLANIHLTIPSTIGLGDFSKPFVV